MKKLYRDRISAVDVNDRLIEGGVDSNAASELAKVLVTKDDLEDVKDEVMEAIDRTDAKIEDVKDEVMKAIDRTDAKIEDVKDTVNRLAVEMKEGHRELMKMIAGVVRQKANRGWDILKWILGFMGSLALVGIGALLNQWIR